MSDEALLLVGRVEGDGEDAVVSSARMEAAGRTVDKRYGSELVLAVDGRRVRVQLTPERIGSSEISGRWDEVAAKRVARLFRDDAPGDHVKVKIEGTAVFPGDVLAVRAVAVAETSGDGGGYREAPERVVEAVRALAAAVGADEAAARAGLEEAEAQQRDLQAKLGRAEAERREQREEEARRKAKAQERQATPVVPFRWLARITGGIAIICFLISAWLAKGWVGLIPLSVGAIASFVIAVQFTGVAVYAWTVRYDLGLVHEVGVNRPTVKREPWPLYVQFGLVAVSIGIALSGYRNPNVLRIGVASTAAMPIVLFIVAVVRAWRPTSRLSLALRARRLPADPPDGKWGVFAGTAGQGERGGNVLAATTTRTSRSRTYTATVHNKDGGSSQEQRTDVWDDVATHCTAEPTFEVTGGGRTARVATSGAIWSAPVRWQPVAKADAVAARALAEVTRGARVRILGRVHRDGDALSFKATGPESLFIVTAPAGGLVLAVLAPVLAQGALIAATALACLW